MIIIIKYGILFTVLLVSTNIEARGGGRGGGRSGSRGRGAVHRGGGGGLAWAFNRPIDGNGYSSDSDPESPYGNTFGNKGLPDNSYIANDYYRYWESDGFLINSLFYGAGMKKTDPEEAKKYYNSIGFEGFYRRWNEENDRDWRKTTSAPYFENKLPGRPMTFPASAVVGAATAFGLVSLLPLNVPAGLPLKYCGNTDLIQSSIRINNEHIYVCNKTKMEIYCKKNFVNRFDHGCQNEEVKCKYEREYENENVYCSYNTLHSKTNMFCNSTTTLDRKDLNESLTIVNCYEGTLPRSRVSFIPTKTTTTEYPLFSTTPKPLSFNANVHVFLLKLMGKSDVLETTTYDPSKDSNAWYPEALTIPPEPTTTTTRKPKSTTTKAPYVWMHKHYKYHENGTVESYFKPVASHLLPYSWETDPVIPPSWYKVYTTSTAAYEDVTTVPSTTSTTEEPYVWMRKIFINNTLQEDKLEPVPKVDLEIVLNFGNFIPKTWVKVPASKVAETTTQGS